MAQAWLLQALYTSLLSSVGNRVTDWPAVESGLGLTVLANTTHGSIVGAVDSSAHPTVYRYLGVPYAKPPLDDLRFKAPENPDPWTGVRSALQVSSKCWQREIPSFGTDFPSSEDCLYLNIYTPARTSDSGLLPVMVWIHGGGYIVGAGAQHNGTLLARSGRVVVVTINYRLNVFGFLSSEDDQLPGNYGLLDQLQALRWVRANIKNFGGDPNAVTIFGESAGGGSVSLLVLSPLARGLFHRAIMESGVSLSPWAFKHRAQRVSPVYGATLIGSRHGCQLISSDAKGFADCLRLVDAETLLKTSVEIIEQFGIISLFTPREETTFGVIPEDPVQMLVKGNFNHVDTLRGFNSHEAGQIKIRNNTVDVRNRSTFAEAFRDLLSPWIFLDADKLLKEFETYYINSSTNDPVYIAQQTSQYLTDFLFASPSVKEITLMTSAAPERNHFLYKFDYRVSYSQQPAWVGAVHGDELRYLFGIGQVTWTEPADVLVQGDASDFSMSDQMIAMWSNFARTGNPTISGSIKWEPFTSSKPRMMIINSALKLVDFSRPGAVQLFDHVMHLCEVNAQPSNNIVG